MHSLTFCFAFSLIRLHEERSGNFVFIQYAIGCLQHRTIGNALTSQNPNGFCKNRNRIEQERYEFFDFGSKII